MLFVERVPAHIDYKPGYYAMALETAITAGTCGWSEALSDALKKIAHYVVAEIGFNTVNVLQGFKNSFGIPLKFAGVISELCAYDQGSVCGS